MPEMLRIGDAIYTPIDNVLSGISKKAGLPQYLEYYYINKDGHLAHMVSVYHNQSEEEVVETKPEKVELAKALKYIHEYFKKS
jgi:hypothetical protein